MLQPKRTKYRRPQKHARKDFNDTAKSYNQAIRQFPKNILAGMFGFEKKSYFEAEAGSEKAPKVEF